MTKKQFEKITRDVNRLLDGQKVKGLNFPPESIREIVRILENYNYKPKFINGDAKMFCDKYGIVTETCGIGWKIK